MNEKPPLDFLLHNLRSLVECIEENYGEGVIELIILIDDVDEFLKLNGGEE
jgi:hypothetical protein